MCIRSQEIDAVVVSVRIGIPGHSLCICMCIRSQEIEAVVVSVRIGIPGHFLCICMCTRSQEIEAVVVSVRIGILGHSLCICMCIRSQEIEGVAVSVRIGILGHCTVFLIGKLPTVARVAQSDNNKISPTILIDTIHTVSVFELKCMSRGELPKEMLQ